jgi:rhodanese-related sulfurtransferase
MGEKGLTKCGEFLVLLLVSCIFYTGSALADVETGARPQVKILDAEALIDLAQHKSDLIVIDSRLKMDRVMGYIENSISLPDDETSCKSLFKISKDKSQPMAFYCNGINCKRSLTAITIARQCQYHNLYWFQGGFEEWRIKDYPYLME